MTGIPVIHVGAESVAGVASSYWEVEVMTTELAYLAKGNSEHGVEGKALILLAAHSKMGGKRDIGGEESCLISMESGLRIG